MSKQEENTDEKGQSGTQPFSFGSVENNNSSTKKAVSNKPEVPKAKELGQSSIEPSFSFGSAEVSAASSSTPFAFGSSSQANPPISTSTKPSKPISTNVVSTQPFNFGGLKKEEASKGHEPGGTTSFTFGDSSSAKAGVAASNSSSTSTFTFGASAAVTTPVVPPSTTTVQPPKTSAPTPSFTFGSNAPSEGSSNSNSAFVFGGTQASTTAEKMVSGTATPSNFTFGASSKAPVAATSVFGGGASQQHRPSVDMMDAANAGSLASPAPSSFGLAGTGASQPSGTFAFGGSVSSSVGSTAFGSASATSFGTSSTTAPSGFNNASGSQFQFGGGAVAQKPSQGFAPVPTGAFSFGGPQQQTQQNPGFGGGSTAGAFSLGSTTSQPGVRTAVRGRRILRGRRKKRGGR